MFSAKSLVNLLLLLHYMYRDIQSKKEGKIKRNRYRKKIYQHRKITNSDANPN